MINNIFLTCIICPIGCSLQVIVKNGKIDKIKGNGCHRGIVYAQSECTNPTRILTTTVKVDGGIFPLVPVKSDKPLPKDLIMACMKEINSIQVSAPVIAQDVIIKNILNTGVNIIAVKQINAKNNHVNNEN